MQAHIEMDKLRDESEGHKLETARSHNKLRTLQGEMELVREREAARRAQARLSSMGEKYGDQDSYPSNDHVRDRNQDKQLDRDKNRERDNVNERGRVNERDREREGGKAQLVSTDADSDSGPTHSSSSVSHRGREGDRGRNRNRVWDREGYGSAQSEMPSIQTGRRDRRDSSSHGIPHPRPLHTQSATPPRRPHYTVPVPVTSSPSSASMSSVVIAGSRATYPISRRSFSRGSSMDADIRNADIRSAASVMSIDTDSQSLPYGGTQQSVSVSGEHVHGSLEPPTIPSTRRHFSEHDLQHYEKHSSSRDRDRNKNESRSKGEHSSVNSLDGEDAYPPRPPTIHSQHDHRNLGGGGGVAASSSSRMVKDVDQPNIRISFDSIREKKGLTSRSKDKDVLLRDTERDIDTVKEVGTVKPPISVNSSIGSRSINSSMQERAERLVSREASLERERVKESNPPHPPTSSSTATISLRESGSPHNLRAGSTYPSSTAATNTVSEIGPMHAATYAPLTNSDVNGGASTSSAAAIRERERERQAKERGEKEKEWERDKEEKEKESNEKVGVVARFDRLQSMFERVTGSAMSAVWRDSDSSDSDD